MNLRPLATAVLGVVLALPLALPAQAQTQSFSPAQRGEIENHPARLPDEPSGAAAGGHGRTGQTPERWPMPRSIARVVKQHAQIIFSSPRQVTLGNPQGDVTVVEFFDYNCAFCKRAMADMTDLMKGDGKVKFVLKEFPVLGEGSTQAAQVAVAVRMQDKTGGKKYLEFHQKLLGGRGQADKARAMAVAKEVGLDMARLEKDMASDEVKNTLQESFKIAEALGLNGTPSYVVGSDVVIGAVGLPALKERVNSTRCGKANC